MARKGPAGVKGGRNYLAKRGWWKTGSLAEKTKGGLSVSSQKTRMGLRTRRKKQSCVKKRKENSKICVGSQLRQKGQTIQCKAWQRKRGEVPRQRR